MADQPEDDPTLAAGQSSTKTVAIGAIAGLAIVGALVFALFGPGIGGGDGSSDPETGEVAAGDSLPASGISEVPDSVTTDDSTSPSDTTAPVDSGAPVPQELPAVNFDCEPVREIPQSECEALVAMFAATGGPHWESTRGWLENHMPCQWEGVRCEGGNVVRLELVQRSYGGGTRSAHFNGHIPAELEDLTQLRSLDLRNRWHTIDARDNNLTGEIPPELGSLDRLEVIDLSGNELSGSIPPEIGNLGALDSLNLDNNNLSGEIPKELGTLFSLMELNFRSNQLTGPVPAEIGELRNLTSVNLSRNDLSGELPQEIAYLEDLERLNLSENRNLTGPIHSVLTQLELRTFDFEDTGLCEPADSAVQDWLDDVVGARSVNLCDETVALATPIAPANDSGFSCDEVGQIPESECRALISLYQNTDGENWRERSGNTIHWLESNRPCEWWGISCEGGHIVELELRQNDLVGSIPPEVGNLTELTFLSFFGNSDVTQWDSGDLRGPIPPELGQLRKLEALNLGYSNFTGPLQAELTAIDGLDILDFGGTDLCEPQDADFQGWLSRIDRVASSDIACD